MIAWRMLLSLGCVLLVTACGGGSWIHPNKPQEAYAQDYNKCEADALKDPKLQQGQRYLQQLATERCLKKMGWMLKSDE